MNPLERERTLLRAWRQGDSAAGHELVKPLLRGLSAFFRCKVACAADVDDLVQRSLLTCQRSLDKYRGEGRFKPFLFGVARHTVLKYYREKHRYRTEHLVEECCAQDLEPDPEYVIMQRADVRLLMKAMRRIPLDYQIALELFHWEHMKGDEIAGVLQIPPATVRSRLRRGLKRLRKKVSELSDSPELLRKSTMSFESWRLDLHERLPESKEEVKRVR